jgi:hypothetical protein
MHNIAVPDKVLDLVWARGHNQSELPITTRGVAFNNDNRLLKLGEPH